MTSHHESFIALSDATRRDILIFLQLEGSGQCAGDIARRFDISWPAVSRHLRILREAGLVWESRDGRNRIYEVNPQAFRALQHWLAQFGGSAAAPARRPQVPTLGREAWS